MIYKLIEAFIPICFAVISWWLAVIIHEAGHLRTGLVTGSSFVSFRIGSYLIYKDNTHLRIRRQSIPGTLGQCIMIPQECVEPDRLKGFLYHGGGDSST